MVIQILVYQTIVNVLKKKGILFPIGIFFVTWIRSQNHTFQQKDYKIKLLEKKI
jgi:hypothetical protein